MSDSLWPHGSRHARPPCPSPTPGVHLKSCPSSWWCHPTISSSVVPFFSCPQSFPASGPFQMSQLFSSVAKVLDFSFNVNPSNEHSGLISFRMDWLDLRNYINNSCLLLLLIQVKLLSHVWLFETPLTPLTPCQSPSQAPLSWDFPGKNTGVDCHFLFHGIFLTQGLNPGLPHCRQLFTIWVTMEAPNLYNEHEK